MVEHYPGSEQVEGGPLRGEGRITNVLVLGRNLRLELLDPLLKLHNLALGPRSRRRPLLEASQLFRRLDQLERDRERPSEKEGEAEGSAGEVHVALGVELARVVGHLALRVGSDPSWVVVLLLLGNADESLDGIDEEEGNEDEGLRERARC